MCTTLAIVCLLHTRKRAGMLLTAPLHVWTRAVPAPGKQPRRGPRPPEQETQSRGRFSARRIHEIQCLCQAVSPCATVQAPQHTAPVYTPVGREDGALLAPADE